MHSASEQPYNAWLQFPDGTIHKLGAAPCNIGRTPPKAIVIPDTFVSGSHAVIESTPDGAHRISDLRSTNGTYLEGRRLNAPAPLHDGDVIRIGRLELIYRRLSRTTDLEEMDSGTLVQSYDGPCWLLLVDLENFTTCRQTLGQEKADCVLREWCNEAKRIIENSGGVINGQPGDALFTYWRDLGPERTLPELHCALHGLLSLQKRMAATTPFRLIVHRGQVQITIDAMRAEHLGSPEVDQLFRLEKQAKPLGVSILFSEEAAKPLSSLIAFKALGRHLIPNFGHRNLYTIEQQTVQP